MPADTSILMGYRQPQIESQDAQNVRAAQAMNVQQQNMLGQAQLMDVVRANQQKNQMRDILSKVPADAPPDAVNKMLEKAYIQSGDIAGLTLHRKSVAEAEAAQAKIGKEKAQTDLAGTQNKAAKLKLFTDQIGILAQNPNDQAIQQWTNLSIENGLMDEASAKTGMNELLALPPEQRTEKLLRLGLTAKDALSRLEPKTDIGKLMFERDKLPADDPRRKIYDDAIKKATTHSPGTNVNVALSTEKKYGEKFAGNIADADVKLKDAAEAAPQLADTSNRISQILKSGQVFTGTGANIKLQLAKALKVAGGTENEAIANTETLISSLASQTLANIKSSGLGSGQGFTDKDREFLQAATAGTITLDNKTLQRLSDLSYRTAVATADKWSKRVKEIPSNAIEGTGLTREPITIPSRAGAAPKPSPVRSAADAILSGSKK